MCFTLHFETPLTPEQAGKKGREDLGQTCAVSFRAIDKHKGKDGDVPLRFNLIIIFPQIVK
jgi:hypothetical protein